MVWRRFSEEGCSVRVLHPQRYCDALWRVVARLEAFLQCPVGANAYLTPAGSQGFAPHWCVGRGAGGWGATAVRGCLLSSPASCLVHPLPPACLPAHAPAGTTSTCL